MVNRINDRTQRPPRPAPHQPGTLLEQVAAIFAYHADQDRTGAHDEQAWQRALRHTMAHVRAAEGCE